MSAILLLVVGLACMAAGYFVYSRFIAQKILKLDPHFQTPSHEINDGVDYVPTNKYVLWGHHFTSVAGAAPIVGPAIAVIWGWAPAFLWVVLGTIFIAGVHDMSAVWSRVCSQLLVIKVTTSQCTPIKPYCGSYVSAYRNGWQSLGNVSNGKRHSLPNA